MTLANKVDLRNGLVPGVQPGGWMAPTGWCDFFFFSWTCQDGANRLILR